MTKMRRAHLALTMICALLVGVAACGGGGGAGGADANPSTSPPVSPPPPPPPSPPPLPPPPSGFRPTLFIERDAAGAAFIRVQEQTYNPFGAVGPARTIADRVLGPSPGVNFAIEGSQTTMIRNVDITRMKHGLNIYRTPTVSIYDYSFTQFDGGGEIHGAAIKLGNNDRPTDGPTYIQRAYGDGRQQPDSSYDVSNTDFIGIERESGPIYIRDVTGLNWGDAGIDTKAGPIYVMNGTFGNMHRGLRVWSNTEMIIVNSIINVPARQTQVWLQDATARLSYWNVLWCREATNPSAGAEGCQSTPFMVDGEEIEDDVAARRITALTSNPLPNISPFFRTQVEEIVIEYSEDAGRTWRRMSARNTGGLHSAPVGDTRYRIPLNLSAAAYRFRAHYLRGGAKVGDTSAVIDEAGAPIG